MKRMLDQKKIDWLEQTDLEEISALLSKVSVEETQVVLAFDENYAISVADDGVYIIVQGQEFFIAVNDDDEIMFNNKTLGTKLYKHRLNINNDDCVVDLISWGSSPITTEILGETIKLGKDYLSCSYELFNDSFFFSPMLIEYSTNKIFFYQDGSMGTNYNIIVSSLTDTVTPL